MVFDDDSLACWERTLQGTLHNLEENPNVMILFRDPATRAAWRFVGKATVHKEGPLREQVMSRTVQAELDRDPERKGYAVIVKVDKVLPVTGQTPMQSRDNRTVWPIEYPQAVIWSAAAFLSIATLRTSAALSVTTML